MENVIYGIIYLIRNEVNNKIYIGQTTQSFDRRYHTKNGIGDTHNEHLKRSIAKHGIANFYIDKEFDIAFSQEELNKLEDMYIEMYNTINPRYGYNKMHGGSNGKLTEETKLKLSNAHKGLKLGEKHHMYGKCQGDETKNKISKTLLESEFTGRKVICITTNKEFDNMGKASRFYNCNQHDIYESCRNLVNGIYRTSGELNKERLKWLYYEDYIKLSKEEVEKILTLSKNICSSRVVCINDNNKEFNKISEASEHYNCDRSGISKVCKGNKPHIKGYVFMYYEDYINLQKRKTK